MKHRIIEINPALAGSGREGVQRQAFELQPGQSVDLAPGEVLVPAPDRAGEVAMYWDGGERAITPREKVAIEEHGPSCFSIPLVPMQATDNTSARHPGSGSSAVKPNVTTTGLCRPAALATELGELPPLPEPTNMGFLHDRNRSLRVTGFTAQQMEDYARAALAGPRAIKHCVTTEAGRAVLEAALPYLETLHSLVGGEARASVWRCIERGRAVLADTRPWADQHSDDVAVDAFTAAMKAKMTDARAKGRGGWQDKGQCSAADLSRLLREHMDKGDPRDVANFCMMLHQRGEAITPRPHAAQTPAFYLRACDVRFLEEQSVSQAQVTVCLEKPTQSAIGFYAAQPLQATDPNPSSDRLTQTAGAETRTQFSWSLDEELFHDRVDSVEDAIAAAIEHHGQELDVGATIYIGEVIPVSVLQLVNADSVIEDIATQAYDLAGESADGYLSRVTTEQEHELEALIAGWAEGVEAPSFWQVGNVIQYTVTAEDLGEACESGQPECGPVTHHDSEGVPLCEGCWQALLADSHSDETVDEPEEGDISRG